MAAPRFDIPTPDMETQLFWDGCKDGVFLVRHCNACNEDHFYPRPFCPKCWSDDVEWKQATGRGTVYTYSIVVQNDRPCLPPGIWYDLVQAIGIIGSLRFFGSSAPASGTSLGRSMKFLSLEISSLLALAARLQTSFYATRMAAWSSTRH